MKALSPKQAIIKHCKLCFGDSVTYTECNDSDCQFFEILHNIRPRTGSSVKRIRLFCIECVETTEFRSKCNGETTNMGFCSLHPFRMAKNPNRNGKGCGNKAHPMYKSTLESPADGDSDTQHGQNGDI